MKGVGRQVVISFVSEGDLSCLAQVCPVVGLSRSWLKLTLRHEGSSWCFLIEATPAATLNLLLPTMETLPCKHNTVTNKQKKIKNPEVLNAFFALVIMGKHRPLA